MTTSCTLLPIIALLLFGGSTLQDFAFALLIGVASGAYSSIFIASPVLTHWKEREHGYKARRDRITAEFGRVPAYADGGDVEPTTGRIGRTGRLTAPQDENVSAAEFEQMKRDLGLEESGSTPRRRPSRLTERTAHTVEDDTPGRLPTTPQRRANRPTATPVAPVQSPEPDPEPPLEVDDAAGQGDQPVDDDGGRSAADTARPVTPAPDEAENEGVAPTTPGPKRPSRPRNRRHGRKR